MFTHKTINVVDFRKNKSNTTHLKLPTSTAQKLAAILWAIEHATTEQAFYIDEVLCEIKARAESDNRLGYYFGGGR